MISWYMAVTSPAITNFFSRVYFPLLRKRPLFKVLKSFPSPMGKTSSLVESEVIAVFPERCVSSVCLECFPGQLCQIKFLVFCHPEGILTVQHILDISSYSICLLLKPNFTIRVVLWYTCFSVLQPRYDKQCVGVDDFT